MTPYDAAMIGVVVAGMVWGAWRGITWQVASIASLVLGYLFAHPLSAQLAPHFPGEPVVARAAAMLVVYALVSGGVFFAAWLVRATLRRLKFEAYDRHLGMVLGGLEGALLGIVVTLFTTSLAPSTRTPIFESRSGRVVAHVMDTVGPILPTEVRDAITPSWGHSESIASVQTARDGTADRIDTSLLDDKNTRWDGFRSRPGEAAERDVEPADRPSLRDLYKESRARLGRAAGKAVEQGVEATDDTLLDELPRETRKRLGRAAGEAVERGVEKGETSTFRELYQQGRARLGRAAGEALEREINRRDDDGRDPRRR